VYPSIYLTHQPHLNIYPTTTYTRSSEPGISEGKFPDITPDYDPDQPEPELQIELTAEEFLELLQFEARIGQSITQNEYIWLSGHIQRGNFQFKPKDF